MNDKSAMMEMPFYKDRRNITEASTGITYNNQEFSCLFSMKYSLSNRYVIHRRHVANILDLLSDFGGVYALLAKGCSLIAEFFTFQYLYAKLSRALYFGKMKKSQDS